MGEALSAILAPAVGVLISPFPIVGLILILLSNKARLNSIFYMLGWIIGNAAVFLIAMFAIGARMEAENEPSNFARLVFLVIGLLSILFAIFEFSRRPKKGQVPKTPKWFTRMGSISAPGVGGVGLFLSALNPEDTLFSLSAGAAIGSMDLSVGQEIGAAIIYTAVASCSIIIPTIAFLIAGKRIHKTLGAARVWLIHNNSVIMAVLFLMIGIDVMSKAFK